MPQKKRITSSGLYRNSLAFSGYTRKREKERERERERERENRVNGYN